MNPFHKITATRSSKSHRGSRTLASMSLGIASLTGVVIVATPTAASAAATTLSSPTTLTGSQTLSSVGVVATDPISGLSASFDLVTTAAWTQPAALVSTSFDPNLVRQGRALNPADSYTRPSPGSMTVSWTLSNLSVSWGSVGPLNLGSPGFSATAPCDLKAGGSNYTCHLASSTIGLLDPGFPAVSPYVDLGLATDVTVTPQGIMTLRQATFAGSPGGSASLTLGETPVTDNLSIPCTVGAGDSLSYALGALSTDPGIAVETSLVFDVGAEFPDPIIPFKEDQVQFAAPTVPLGMATSDISMTGPGATFDMGAVQANNIPPVVSAGGPYAGNEGSAFSFDGSGSSSICGFPTLQWNFSDEGVAYGEYPQHTFPGSGTYSGLLTATDVTGLTSTTTFSVSVTNLPPLVSAGPDATTAWGRLVAFNGSATDPGSADQSTLAYSWDFGDGSGSGGASTLHVYSTPGDYVATLTVTDQYGASASSSRTIHVTRRDTTTAYSGDTSGTFDTPSTLQASVVDQFGQPVIGRTVTFQVDSDGPFTALTNSSGVVTRSYVPTLASGTYTGSAAFAGDALYNASSSTESFAVAKKATTTLYTGAVAGAPNKTVALSASLTDATGKPLAGRTVNFQLGTQSASAVTNLLGTATTSLKLSQKNGTYTVSATYNPAGNPPDGSHYLGSSQSASFKLQSK